MICQKCGTNVPENARFCPNCGAEAQQTAARCSRCQAELKPGAVFCAECGQPVNQNAVPPAQPPVQTQGGPAVQQHNMSGPGPQPTVQQAYTSTGSADKPPLTWGNLLKAVGTNTLQGIKRSLPMMIVMFLIGMVVHTYLLVFVNEGFGADTWLGRQFLATQGNFISATIMWMLISGFIFSSIPRIRALGLKGYIDELMKVPQNMADYVKQSGQDGLTFFLGGLGLAMVISGIMSDVANIFLAIGVAGLFASPVGRVLAILLQSTWATVISSLNPEQGKKISRFGVVSAYLSIIGSSAGFVLAAVIPSASALGFLLLVVLAVLTYMGRNPAGGAASGFFFIVTIGLVVLRAKGVLADDGGWQEAGGTFSSWAGSEGSVKAVLHGTGPSIGAAVGPALNGALSGIDPKNFNIPQSPGDESGQEEPSDTSGTDEGKVYDDEGYDQDGYDRDGYDRDGYDRNGYDRNGYDRDGYDRNGYDREGYDRNGKDREGFYRNGYNDEGYDREGYDAEGYDRQGYNKEGLDREGYDRDGFNSEGFDREGYGRDGYNKEGYDREGFNREGYDRDGYDRDGFNKEGIDREGYNRDGYDSEGYDRNGFNREGYDREGYDRKGFDRDGFDRDGYGRDGFNKEGYDRDGYDKNGYDRDGYDRDGFNAKGWDRDGYDRDGYDRRGFNRDGVNREGKTIDQVKQELAEKLAKLKKDQASANSSAWWWDVGTTATEWVGWGADKSIDLLANVTGPAGGRIKDIYTVAKGTAEGLGEAIADGKDYASHIAKGTLKGVTDLGLGKIIDAGAGKVTDLTGGKLPGFKEYTPFNPEDAAWGGARSGFIKDALLGKENIDGAVSDMVRDKFGTAAKNVLQGTLRDKVTKDPIMDSLFSDER